MSEQNYDAAAGLDSATSVTYLTLAITLKAGKICGLQAVSAVQNWAETGQPTADLALSSTGTICTSSAKGPEQSPYLNAVEAAAYLGISRASLYRIVERRRLEPLRGPKRTYRFTRQILDDYLRAGSGRKRR